MNVTNETSVQELSFPWLPNSSPPFIGRKRVLMISVDEILCNYRNYKIPKITVDLLIQTRLNEGFLLKHCNVSKSSKMKYEISLVRPLALHIKILYTMKFSLHETDSLNTVPSKAIRIDVHVLAHHSFAILFMNVHNLETTSKTDSMNTIIYGKLVRLHSVLRSISEADETLQILCQFNSPSAMLLSKQLVGTMVASELVNEVELPSNYWHFLNQAIMMKPWMLESKKMTVLLRSTSLQTNLGARAFKSFKISSDRTRYQVATIYLSRFLSSWTSFSLSKTTYFRWLYDGVAAQPTGFCLVQVMFETESLMTITARFFGRCNEEREEIFHRFRGELGALEHVNRHTPSEGIKPIFICVKPIEKFIIYYSVEGGGEGFKANSSPARSYLWNKSWNWFGDIVKDSSVEVLLDNAFITLYNLRVMEGYLRLAEGPGTVTFYKEIEIDSGEEGVFGGMVCSVQYVILYDPPRFLLRSELWMEPVRHHRKNCRIDDDFDGCLEVSKAIHDTVGFRC
jgi:hypothetical protein